MIHFILIHTLFTKMQSHLNSVIYLEEENIIWLHRMMHFSIHCHMSELSVRKRGNSCLYNWDFDI